MEILRSLLFILALHLSMYYSRANITSVKKKKSLNKPHGGHVAHNRGWSKLFDPHGGNTSLPNIAPVAVSSESISQQEAMIAPVYPVESSREEKKRKRRRKKNLKKMLKKMRDESLVGYQQAHSYPKRKCRNWNECKKDECCIRYSSTKGYCKRRPQKGHRCKPILLPGLRDCPCDEGLTCARYKTTKWGLKKHRCERLRFDEDEKEQRQAGRTLKTAGNRAYRNREDKRHRNNPVTATTSLKLL